MKVTIHQEGKETVIKIAGRLDTNTSREYEDELLGVWKKSDAHTDPIDVCIDCSDLEYVSSAGLRLFLLMQKTATAGKGNLRLTGMRKEIRDVFNVTGFNAIFKIDS